MCLRIVSERVGFAFPRDLHPTLAIRCPNSGKRWGGKRWVQVAQEREPYRRASR